MQKDFNTEQDVFVKHWCPRTPIFATDRRTGQKLYAPESSIPGNKNDGKQAITKTFKWLQNCQKITDCHQVHKLKKKKNHDGRKTVIYFTWDIV